MEFTSSKLPKRKARLDPSETDQQPINQRVKRQSRINAEIDNSVENILDSIVMESFREHRQRSALDEDESSTTAVEPYMKQCQTSSIETALSRSHEKTFGEVSEDCTPNPRNATTRNNDHPDTQLESSMARIRAPNSMLQQSNNKEADAKRKEHTSTFSFWPRKAETARLATENGRLTDLLDEKGRVMVQLEAQNAEQTRMLAEAQDYQQGLVHLVKHRETRIAELEAQVLAMGKRIEACNAELCKLKPTDTFTDADILAEYESLSQSIANWIDKTFDRLDQAASLQKHSRVRLTVAGGDRSTDAICAANDSAVEYLMRARISYMLQKHVFTNEKYLPGLGAAQREFLDAIEDGMKCSNASGKPKSGRSATSADNALDDVSSILQWRSETLTALCASPGYKSAQEMAGLSLARIMEQDLNARFRGLQAAGDFYPEILAEVVSPALHLDKHMRLSRTPYEFTSHVPERSCFERQDLKQNDLKLFKAIDLRSRKNLENVQSIMGYSNGVVAQEMLVVEEGLVRMQIADRPAMWLAKPTAAIHLIAPLPSQHKTNKPV